MDADRLLDGLNDAQRRAVVSEVTPICILAGAGSGKTRVLTHRIAHRAATGAHDPRHVLALTFTRKAAGELQRRLRSLGLRDRVVAGTFHSVAYAQLRARWADTGVEPPEILERKAEIVARLLPPRTPRRDTALLDVIGEIEWAKARRIMPATYAEHAESARRRVALPHEQVAALFDRYEKEKRRRRLVDFDDLLSLCRREIARDDAFAAAQRWRFQHLFVDEYQDVNPLQHALLEAWRGGRRDLCVVGDPNQAIYSWNGADPELLTGFERHNPGCEIVRLADNYRSSPQVLAVANAVLAGAPAARRTAGTALDVGALRPNRPDGPPPSITAHPTGRAEAAAIARRVRDAHAPGTSWNAQAVLVRTNAQTALVEEALGAAGIPFRVRGGAGLLDQPEIKDALRELRRGARSFEQALADLRTMVDEARAADDPRPDELRPDELRPDEAAAVAADPAGDAHVANLAELLRLAGDFAAVDAAPTVTGFVAWLRQTARSDRPDAAGDAVDVATFHAAKGLEWSVVHLAGLEQGLVPISYARTPSARDEERRLFYVAVTRAERELHLTWAESRDHGTRTVERTPSPYLAEVEAALRALEDDGEPTVRPARPGNQRRGGTRARERSPVADLGEADAALADELRAWRSRIAKGAGVPAYVVFNDATLTAIATSRPASHAALLDVPGIGPVKANRYGEDVLALVAAHGAP